MPKLRGPVEITATPLVRLAVPMETPPSKKVTLPTGLRPDTAAVSVTGWPGATWDDDALRETNVALPCDDKAGGLAGVGDGQPGPKQLPTFTTTGVAEELGRSLPSPL